MWWGDVEAGTLHMQPTHAFIVADLVLAPDRTVLDAKTLDLPTRAKLLALVAGYLPYYTTDPQARSPTFILLPSSFAAPLNVSCTALRLCSAAAHTAVRLFTHESELRSPKRRLAGHPSHVLIVLILRHKSTEYIA